MTEAVHQIVEQRASATPEAIAIADGSGITTYRELNQWANALARSSRSWLVVLGFLLVGVYGGFLQAGVGFVVLAITTWSGLDLVRGNAIKIVTVLLVTVLALAIFAINGTIHWPMGLALAVGNTIGGLLGVRLAIAKGHRWLKGAVTVTIIAFAVRLWFQ